MIFLPPSGPVIDTVLNGTVAVLVLLVCLRRYLAPKNSARANRAEEFGPGPQSEEPEPRVILFTLLGALGMCSLWIFLSLLALAAVGQAHP